MKCNNDTHILQTCLEQYAADDLYPLHMPGHKRRLQPAPGLPSSWDVTEVPGTDDLHDARGILREAMQRTASLCGADRTWYLVNGSTCGLLAGIRALAPRGSEIICARNCHKAVFHAIELSGYRVHWILPPIDPDWGICGGVTAAQVRACLRRHPSSRAVILTSPTYEGVLSEIRLICEACHEKNIPVLVDEAHGAHLLPLSAQAGFPEGALTHGADIVVHSPHKTLPSLTQTALLHLKGCRVDSARIEAELDIFETSSPSYPLMASLDGCTGILRENGRELFDAWAERIARFDNVVRPLRSIRILFHTHHTHPADLTDKKTHGGPHAKTKMHTHPADLTDKKAHAGPHAETKMHTHPADPTDKNTYAAAHAETETETDTETAPLLPALYDPGKILIDAWKTGMTGTELAAVLRKRFKLETEMTAGRLVLAMTGAGDAEDALDRLADALLTIDAESNEKNKTADASRREASCAAAAGVLSGTTAITPVSACTIAQALGQETEEVPLHKAAGRICAEYLYYYPPGIPFLAPGELISSEAVSLYVHGKEQGAIPYCHDRKDNIRCLRE